MIDETVTETAQDTTLADLQAASGDYSEYLSVIAENQQTEIQLLQEQNAALAEVTQVCWWLFFIFAFYGIYKLFLSNFLSWFNGS